MLLETERLIIRELVPSDFDALFKVLGDPLNMRHYPYVFDDALVHVWINRNKERYQTFGFGLWGVCLKETGELIGDCGLSMQNIHGTIRPEIGYHIRRDLHRRGYAKEAAIAVRDWTFQNTPFKAIYSYMKSANVESRATALSWGCQFKEDYIDDDNESTSVYVLTKEVWQQIIKERK